MARHVVRLPILVALVAYGDRHFAGPEGPPLLIVHKECGGVVDDRRICRRCGTILQSCADL